MHVCMYICVNAGVILKTYLRNKKGSNNTTMTACGTMNYATATIEQHQQKQFAAQEHNDKTKRKRKGNRKNERNKIKRQQ